MSRSKIISKIVKKWGGSLIVTLNKEDQQIFNVNEGDILDINIIDVKKSKGDESENV